MALFYFLGFGVAGALLWSWLDRRRLAEMARSRPMSTWEQFGEELLTNGASKLTADFIRDEFRPYFVAGLTPQIHDSVFSTLRIDPGDIEDIVQRYWEVRGWELPSLSEPQIVPSDPSLQEFAVWLEHAGQPPESKR